MVPRDKADASPSLPPRGVSFVKPEHLQTNLQALELVIGMLKSLSAFQLSVVKTKNKVIKTAIANENSKW